MKNFVRLPLTKDRSLKAWNAADEHLLKCIEEENLDVSKVVIFHDRYGYLSTNLAQHSPTTFIYLKSQSDAISTNAISNDIEPKSIRIKSILESASNSNNYIIKIPKSLDLFRLYLIKICDACQADSKVLAGFMTRHFSKSIITIAEEYFENVTQSKAWKKSRVLNLSKPKIVKSRNSNLIHTIIHDDHKYQQYLGVFSAKHIDFATQFLLDHLQAKENENSFLDIGTGNGIIGKHLLDQKSWKNAILMDDSILATASSQLNTSKYPSVEWIADYHLDSFSNDQFDLIITNPPFHFEFEVDPSIALQLMEDSYRILATGGRLIVVANRHLNYKSQLSKWYPSISILNENEKFVIYEAYK